MFLLSEVLLDIIFDCVRFIHQRRIITS